MKNFSKIVFLFFVILIAFFCVFILHEQKDFSRQSYDQVFKHAKFISTLSLSNFKENIESDEIKIKYLLAHELKKEQSKAYAYFNHFQKEQFFAYADLEKFYLITRTDNENFQVLSMRAPLNNNKNSILLLCILFSMLALLAYVFMDGKKRLRDLQKAKDDMQKAKDEELHFTKYHDNLTDLPNRNQLIKDLSSQGEDISIIVINIDNFKEINDFYNLEIGDEVLISFSEFLKSFANENNFIVYKLHADEYALLASKKDKVDVVKNILDLIVQVKYFNVITDINSIIEIAITLGVASGNGNTVLSKANMALKKAKHSSLPYIYYEDDLALSNNYQYNIEWIKKIHAAIKQDRIVIYVQPIVYLCTKRLRNYEVLVRMIDENGKVIAPYAFLEVAKHNKIYYLITKRVIELSFDFFSRVNRNFSVNISILDMQNEETVAFIIDKLKYFPHPENITFEILESEGVDNYDYVTSFIEKTKRFGCHIAIDDFGSGYANFEYLLKLNVDIIKFDASLIKHIDTDKNSQLIVQTISDFTKHLNLETCAEFVWNESVYNKLKEINTIRYIQGYFISEPIPLSEVPLDDDN